jgi:5-methyltetrahydrofolate--homocysteine methyltransferase
MTDVLQEIFKGIIDGDTPLTVSKVEEALKQGIDAETILNQGMVASMAEVGKLFEAGEFFVPEMMVSARAMQNGLNLLKPHLVKANVKSAGKVAAGTVQGDLHDIGKNLVCLMLEGAGFEIIDLGVNVTPQQFIDAIRTKGAEFIVMSALLTTTMTSMQDTITALKESGLRDKVRVMVGGAPVTEQYAAQIGADGYAPDASRAVTLAKRLMEI